MDELEKLRYPIGKFSRPDQSAAADLANWINEIKAMPGLLAKEMAGLSKDDYQKTYRPGGWNIAQLVHHLSDSHMNSFIRYKLSITEDLPTIKPYLENKWSEMTDNTDLDPIHSLDLLTALHARWAYLLEHMSEKEFSLGYIHPEKNRFVSLTEATALYAWHCKHHLAHIRLAKAND